MGVHSRGLSIRYPHLRLRSGKRSRRRGVGLCQGRIGTSRDWRSVLGGKYADYGHRMGCAPIMDGLIQYADLAAWETLRIQASLTALGMVLVPHGDRLEVQEMSECRWDHRG